MSIIGTDHIVIAVRDIEDGIRNWRDGLGLSLSHTVDLEEAGIRQAFFALDDGTFIELIAPAREGSPLDAALDSRDEGIHVLSLRVDNTARIAGATGRIAVAKRTTAGAGNDLSSY